MSLLTHYRLCPFSRSIRLALAELQLPVEFAEELPWEWRPEFLALNPSGDLPVLIRGNGVIITGSYAISEYLGEIEPHTPPDEIATTLFSGDNTARAEIRRLVDWFHGKLDREVTREMLRERLHSRLRSELVSQAPDVDLIRALRTNLRYHLSYVNHLADQRRWLAGDALSFADLAAAGHLSCLDYLGEVPWESYPVAREWYQRIKSRPSFRPLLVDRCPGVPPPPHYDDLDF